MSHVSSLPLPIKKDPRYKDRLLEITERDDIPRELLDTPVESLIMRLNFGWPVASASRPQLLIATCIEFRFALPIPQMYSYTLRRASGRLLGSEFTIGYCLSQGVEHIAMLGHNDCGMTRAVTEKPRIIDAYVNQGWSRAAAEEFVESRTARYHMLDELDGLEEEYHRLRNLFRKVTVAPLFVSLYDGRLYLPKFYLESLEHPKYLSYSVPDSEISKL